MATPWNDARSDSDRLRSAIGPRAASASQSLAREAGRLLGDEGAK